MPTPAATPGIASSSLALLLGVGAFTRFGWWSADLLGALAILPVIFLAGLREPSAKPASTPTITHRAGVAKAPRLHRRAASPQLSPPE